MYHLVQISVYKCQKLYKMPRDIDSDFLDFCLTDGWVCSANNLVAYVFWLAMALLCLSLTDSTNSFRKYDGNNSKSAMNLSIEWS